MRGRNRKAAGAGALVEPPGDLEDAAKGIWREFAALMHPSITRPGLEALVAQVARMRDAQTRIAKDGAVVIDAKGNAVPHPAIDIERRAGDEVRRWVARYGR